MPRVYDTVRALIHEVGDDDLVGESAKVAYYLSLSIFPLVITVFAATGLIGGQAAFQWVMAKLSSSVPAETAGYLARFVAEITNKPRPGVFSVGVVLTLWSASGGIDAIGEGLNKMYDLDESRAWWKRKLTAIGLVVLMTAVLIAGGTAVVAGPALANTLHLGPVGSVLGYVLSFAVAVALFYALYYVLPDKSQKACKGRVLVGAISGAAAWLVATTGFRFYVGHFGSYGKTYGALGGIIVLMLWLYLTAMAILFGGEVASVLEERAGARKDESRRAEEKERARAGRRRGGRYAGDWKPA